MTFWQWLVARLRTRPTPPPPLFIGDYRTGDFSQYFMVQNKSINASPSEWIPDYPAQIVDGVARYEVRDGDVMAHDGRERSEVSTNYLSAEGDTHWYKMSTMFDPSFPLTWAEGDGGVTSQWHAENRLKIPPPLALGYGHGAPAGRYALIVNTGMDVAIWHVPLDPGRWHHVVMQVTWSRDPAVGAIRLWHNGVRQSFNGQGTWRGQTLANDNIKVYYKEGLYRKTNGMTATGIIHHKGFVCAATEPSLYV